GKTTDVPTTSISGDFTMVFVRDKALPSLKAKAKYAGFDEAGNDNWLGNYIKMLWEDKAIEECTSIDQGNLNLLKEATVRHIM
ncbi:hypothetical protein GGI19_004109, partial [Coemansia pectinata]